MGGLREKIREKPIIECVSRHVGNRNRSGGASATANGAQATMGCETSCERDMSRGKRLMEDQRFAEEASVFEEPLEWGKEEEGEKWRNSTI